MIRLVIDASVVGKQNKATETTQCKRFLNVIFDNDYQLVMNEAIGAEWRKHRTGFSLRWYSNMSQSGRIFRLSATEYEHIRQKIEVSNISPKITEEARIAIRKQLLKDWLLIEASLQTDQRVVSLDERVRGHYHRLTSEIGELRAVVWVNPTKPEEQSIVWLKNGAPAEEFRMLGA